MPNLTSNIVKINPEEYTGSVDLSILNEFKDYILKSSARLGDKTQDCLNVINCLLFIKVNEEFIKYAIANPDDDRIYSNADRDKPGRLLRDFNGLSFHFASYGPLQANQGWDDFLKEVQQVEQAYVSMKEQEFLEDFALEFEWTQETGCLNARTAAPLAFAACPIMKLDKLIEKAIRENDIMSLVDTEVVHETTVKDIHQLIFDYFIKEDLFGNNVIVGEMDSKKVIVLTRYFFANYLKSHLTNLWGNELNIDVEKNLFLPAPSQENITWSKLHELTQKQCTLIKTIHFSENHTTKLDAYLDQLLDLSKRPTLVGATREKENTFDPSTQRIRNRESSSLGISQRKLFPKKSPFTLLPKDGQIRVYSPDEQRISLTFRLDFTHTKDERYTFKANVNSNLLMANRWHGAPRSVGLAAVRKHNMQAQEVGITLSHNEQLIAAPIEAFLGMAPTVNTLEARINLLLARVHVQQKIANKFGCQLVLHLQNSHHPIAEYTLAEQLRDLIQYNKTSKSNLEMNNFDKMLGYYKPTDMQGKVEEMIVLQELYLNFHEDSPQAVKILELWVGSFNQHVIGNDINDTMKMVITYLEFAYNLPNMQTEALLEVDRFQVILDQVLRAPGLYPLHYAARTNQTGSLLHLIKSKPESVYELDTESKTILHHAAFAQDDIAARMLVEKFPKLINYLDSNGNAAICYATMAGHTKLFHLLIKNGADINIRNKQGDTLLHLACQNNHLELVRYLVAKSRNLLDTPNCDNKSAMDYLKSRRNQIASNYDRKIANAPQDIIDKKEYISLSILILGTIVCISSAFFIFAPGFFGGFAAIFLSVAILRTSILSNGLDYGIISSEYLANYAHQSFEELSLRLLEYSFKDIKELTPDVSSDLTSPLISLIQDEEEERDYIALTVEPERSNDLEESIVFNRIKSPSTNSFVNSRFGFMNSSTSTSEPTEVIDTKSTLHLSMNSRDSI